MKSFLEDAKLVIFDLDGTLYEDTDHFDYYAELLKEELRTEEEKKHFQIDYEAMKAGNHIVKIGKAYDAQRDNILTLDPMTLQVTEVHNWDGQLIHQSEVGTLYKEPLVFNFETMIAIGDGWWLPLVTALHYGIKDTFTSYNKTKEYMVTENFELTKTPGLKQGLLNLKKTKQIVLCTNSDLDDVIRLLKELDLEGIFDYILPSSMKPTKTAELFQSLFNKFNIAPQESVSIGDNFINEIAPALKLGMKAVYIQSESREQDNPNVFVVPTLANVW